MRGIAHLALKRSVGAMGFPALLALIGLHIFSRERLWTHEWLWAVYQYHFATVLVGPAAAGLAAWEGLRARRAEDLLEASGHADRAVFLAWAAVFVWVLIAYATGLLIVVALVKISGTGEIPGLTEVLTIFPAVALLACETAASFAIGWRVRSPLVAPGAALAWFLITLAVYTMGPETAIRVGGATASLVGLRPRLSVQAAQVFLYSSAAVVSLWWTRPRTRDDGGALSGFARAPVVVVPVLAAILVARLSPGVLEVAPTGFECYGTNPVVCAAPGYVKHVREVHAALQRYMAALEDLGIHTPTRFNQGVYRNASLAASLPTEIFFRPSDSELARSALLAWYIPPGCDINSDSRLLEDYLGLDYWLSAEVEGKHPYDPTVPNVLASGSRSEQREWAQGALAEIEACAA